MVEVHDRVRGRDARRQAILGIARDVFLSDGYAAASMSLIAARVGVSKGTLYNYFPSKETLFTAVVREHCALMHTGVYDFDLHDRDVERVLRTLGVRYATAILSEEVQALHRLVVAESCRFPEIGKALYDAGPRPGLARLASYIDQAMAAGRLRPADPARAAEQLMDLYLSGLYKMRLWNVAPFPSGAEISANVDAGLATFMAAFGPGEGRSAASDPPAR